MRKRECVLVFVHDICLIDFQQEIIYIVLFDSVPNDLAIVAVENWIRGLDDGLNFTKTKALIQTARDLQDDNKIINMR